jgi:hypothetical protein
MTDKYTEHYSKPVVEPDDMLPIGVEEKNGNYFAVCRSCEREYELCFDPIDFNEDTNYCGGSPRCLP